MKELKKRIFTSFFLILILFTSFIEIKILFSLLLFINFTVLDELIKMFRKIYINNKFKQLLLIIVSLIYLVIFSLIIILFLSQSFETNKIKILFILFICIATDIGGYFFGNIIGGRKITKISPNKTYAGLIGSFIFALFIGYFFNYFFTQNINLNLNVFIIIILISSISQIGDLFISYLKRKAKIKDTGSFLPGHGGILDRIDGILFALPVGVIIV